MRRRAWWTTTPWTRLPPSSAPASSLQVGPPTLGSQPYCLCDTVGHTPYHVSTHILCSHPYCLCDTAGYTADAVSTNKSGFSVVWLAYRVRPLLVVLVNRDTVCLLCNAVTKTSAKRQGRFRVKPPCRLVTHPPRLSGQLQSPCLCIRPAAVSCGVFTPPATRASHRAVLYLQVHLRMLVTTTTPA